MAIIRPSIDHLDELQEPLGDAERTVFDAFAALSDDWTVYVRPKVGGYLVQTEDELSAIGAVIGGSFAGVKSMTATSGPGLALMTEMLGLASMAEVPAR